MSDQKNTHLNPAAEDIAASGPSNGVQPPPYTPSTAPSSPHITAQGLYPQLTEAHHHEQSTYQAYQPTYQHPKFDTSKPPPPTHHQQQNNHPSCMASPLILMNPPTNISDLRSKPAVVVCQHCNYLVLTEVEREAGSCTFLSVLGLFLAGVTSCGCCLLPLCISSGKDTMHSCPNCHEDIGLFSRLKGKTFPVRRNV